MSFAEFIARAVEGDGPADNVTLEEISQAIRTASLEEVLAECVRVMGPGRGEAMRDVLVRGVEVQELLTEAMAMFVAEAKRQVRSLRAKENRLAREKKRAAAKRALMRTDWPQEARLAGVTEWTRTQTRIHEILAEMGRVLETLREMCETHLGRPLGQ